MTKGGRKGGKIKRQKGKIYILRYMLESNACGDASGRRELRLLIYSGYVPNYRLLKKF